jgi:hypothetical protein
MKRVDVDLGYWELPKPPRGRKKDWHVIPKLRGVIPFGYKIHEENPNLLEPIPLELEALELAKQHLKQYTYRDVAAWLQKKTGRSITFDGLKKRVDIENKRRRSAAIKKGLAKRLKKTLEEIEKLEKKSIGAYSKV